MEEKISLIVVAGPTASGKTKLAVGLARRFGGEVISADSMQIYRDMNIGTAKPMAAEMGEIPHHLLDFLDPKDSFSVAEFVKLARERIHDIMKRGRMPIVAGGTGLYINSLIDHVEYAPIEYNAQLRAQLEEEAREKGKPYMLERLREVDPVLANGLHPNNSGRVIRALEVYRLTGIPMSVHQKQAVSHESPYHPCMVGLKFQDRSKLYDRINQRVDLMMEQGLLAELRGLLDNGYSPTAFQAIGYKELCFYLDGKQSLTEAVEMIKMETRRYAKRQLTWFRRDPRVHWIDLDELEDQRVLETASDIVAQELHLT